MWQPIETPAPVSSAAPYHYGGHRGGHNRRRDGLCAGSPAAIAADRAKDAERKRRARAAAREAVLNQPTDPGTAEIQPALPAPASAIIGGKTALAIVGLSLVAMLAEHLAASQRLDELTQSHPTPRNPFL